MSKLFVIAECGVNHNNSLKKCYDLINVAIDAGADAVKFQVFKTQNYITKNAPLAKYQRKNVPDQSNQYSMIKKLELSENKLIKIKKYCLKKKIIFFLSPFDKWGLDFIKNNNINLIKIPSGEINNYPYLRDVGKLKKEVILSTGMSTISEIDYALKILKKNGTKKINILHCHSDYPSMNEDLNLNVIKTFKKKYKYPIGYSDHTKGYHASIAAVALGSTIIEKHLTLNNNLKGPDHKASLNPKKFKEFVKLLRNTEVSLGSSIKKPTLKEKQTLKVARKSIVANHSIKKGEIFSEKNLICKRPALGINPKLWNKIIGRKSNKDYKKNEFIKITL
tara:strand:+ start:5756 stop:6760 length:1005 start_codon:yes stop_codon:yes gene_type:complete